MQPFDLECRRKGLANGVIFSEREQVITLTDSGFSGKY
jgi:hypothetical protein